MHSLKITPESTIKKAMKKIDENGLGIVFLVNSSGKLVGIITDGDIRRAILRGLNIFTLCKKIMTKNFIKIDNINVKERALQFYYLIV